MKGNNNMKSKFERWISIIRMKAEYDHEARKLGNPVTYPDLDNICNEMEAFLDGYLACKACLEARRERKEGG